MCRTHGRYTHERGEVLTYNPGHQWEGHGRLLGTHLGGFLEDSGLEMMEAGMTLGQALTSSPSLLPPPRVFFRRHYPLTTLRFCGMDPEQRK